MLFDPVRKSARVPIIGLRHRTKVLMSESSEGTDIWALTFRQDENKNFFLYKKRQASSVESVYY